MLEEQLASVEVDRPIFIAGLARSGSTILLELLSSIPGVATHRYRDFPLVFAPWIWNWFVDRGRSGPAQPVERAHADRIKITPESPEAMEEPLWMAFFDSLHDPRESNVLDRSTSDPGFEKFYREHIRKLLLLRQSRRYASKGNYNVSRMAYLLKQFPDARFVVPVRDPVTHIASLMKQHRLFDENTADNDRALNHLRQVGHFEFGPIRTPINVGATDVTERVQALWRAGEEVRGWASYWNSIYGFVGGSLQSDSELRAATLIVQFEEFCESPERITGAILDHCQLEADPDFVREFASRISLPTYYDLPFSRQEQAVIKEETDSAVALIREVRSRTAG